MTTEEHLEAGIKPMVQSSDSDSDLKNSNAGETVDLQQEFVLTDAQVSFCVQGMMRCPSTLYLYYQSFPSSSSCRTRPSNSRRLC